MKETKTPKLSATRRGRPRQDMGAAALNDDRPFVTSLARGLSILRAFHAEDLILGTQAIAERTGLHKTTVSRLLGTLTTLGYLRYLPEYGKYAVSNQVLTLGVAAIGRFGFAEMVRGHMEEIASGGDCVVALSVRDINEMMFVELIRKPTAVALNLNVGSRIPLALSAPGRAYLAAADAAERERLYPALEALHGDEWDSVLSDLEAAIERFETQGYADSFGDWNPRHNAIGIPVREPLTGDIYTISVGGNAELLPPEKLRAQHLPKLLAAAQAMSSLGSNLR
ncbi:IclR family transcriptional regulator [Marinovum sp.]|uniref:IclR family transcriptional regulator n=1 Tax=Marinovum sp. TaxID=2024839 RepID=UPI002B269B96|nr:IclR family transcriptional regulator [Marinovum sp.]